MPKLEIEEGLKIHYQWAGGDTDGPVIVLAHGLTGNLAIWHLHIAPALQDRCRVLTYDLRGHGYSTMTPTGYSADSHAEDLRRLLDGLEISEAFVVGHSLGADVGMYFAINNPDRVSHLLAIEPGMPALMAEHADENWEGWDYWGEALIGNGLEIPPDKRTDFEYLMRMSLQLPKQWGPLRGLPRNPKKALKLLDDTNVLWDMLEIGSMPLERFPELTVPVTLMYSEDTGFLTTKELLTNNLPQAEVVMLPRTDMGHFGPLEQPELVAKHILELIDA
jgi:pimeloyl-ACP methyl ester carboxylesterase